MDLDYIYQKKIIKYTRMAKKGRIRKAWALLGNAFLRLFFSCDISVYCKLGEIKIPHAIGIVIGSSSEIGDGCVIMSNVCIGSTFGDCSGKNHKHAKIGKNCVIGANSSIIGGCVIGDNCIIGAGSVITKDIPDNSVVVGCNQIIREVKQTDGRVLFNC